jgi:hypothetical protein
MLEMANAVKDEVRGRRVRLLIILAVVLVVGAASLSWTAWIDGSLESEVSDTRREAEEFFGDDASAWHAAVADALLDPLIGTSSAPDGWEQVRAAQSLGNADTVGVVLRDGRDSDIVLDYRFLRFGSERCLIITVDSAGKSSYEEAPKC